VPRDVAAFTPYPTALATSKLDIMAMGGDPFTSSMEVFTTSGVNFINIFFIRIFRTNIVLVAFSSYTYIGKAAKMTFLQKKARVKIDGRLEETRCFAT
jgi:hypothetical protein